jgi:hypothetical protein
METMATASFIINPILLANRPRISRRLPGQRPEF